MAKNINSSSKRTFLINFKKSFLAHICENVNISRKRNHFKMRFLPISLWKVVLIIFLSLSHIIAFFSLEFYNQRLIEWVSFCTKLWTELTTFEDSSLCNSSVYKFVKTFDFGFVAFTSKSSWGKIIIYIIYYLTNY